MPGLEKTLAAIPAGQTRRVYGTAYWDGTKWFANLGGNLVDARWMDPIQPLQGGKIIVDITSEGRGLGSALVIGGYTDQPRPSTGTVLTLSPDMVISGEFGGSFTTDRYIGAYALGDPVYLVWDAAKPTVIGKIPSASAAPPPAPPVGGGATPPGSTTLIPTASDTFGVGGWGRWAGSRNGGEKVYSGTQSGYVVTGSWFYGTPRPELAGKTYDRVRFYIPPRLPGVGTSGAVTIHIYGHTSGARPAGDVARTVGPHNVTLPAGFNGAFEELDPAVFGPVLAAGGGLSIAGDPYTGFFGRLDNPEFGRAVIDWRA